MIRKDPRRKLPIKLFRTSDAWEEWLVRHHASAPGLWLRIAKKAARLTSVTYAEALDVALCHGWIDGQRLSHDDQTFLQKFTPRGPRSLWSKINVGKVEALMAGGRMRDGGREAVARAKADGRWSAAYHPQRTATPPRDLLQALARSPKAKALFAKLSSQNRYAIIFRVTTAHRPELRAKRIERFVEMLAQGKTIYPQTPPLSKSR
jgi:uncharacterized protein YdeI (YjbR/CyaY-like superfamily)